MKSIKKFEGKKIKNLSDLKAGARFRTDNPGSGDSYKDKYNERTGLYETRVGLFDGPRD